MEAFNQTELVIASSSIPRRFEARCVLVSKIERPLLDEYLPQKA